MLSVAPLTNAGSVWRWAAQTFRGREMTRRWKTWWAAPRPRACCACRIWRVSARPSTTRRPAASTWASAVRLAPAIWRGRRWRAWLTRCGPPPSRLQSRIAIRWRRRPSRCWAAQAAARRGARSLPMCWARRAGAAAGLAAAGAGQRLPGVSFLGWSGSLAAYRQQVLSAQHAAVYRANEKQTERHTANFARFQRLYPAVRDLF